MAARRVRKFTAAGLVDSFGLALGWTTFNLYAVAHGGLEAVGFYGAAFLAGIALSAPVAKALCHRLTGRSLIRSAGVAEAVLRVASLTALVAGAPALVVALIVAASGVTAWTGFAGMRAEIAAASPGSGAMARYMGLIAAVEAAGAAAAALLPAGLTATLTGRGFAAVVGVYALSLVPTLIVAGDARVQRATHEKTPPFGRDLAPLAGGFAVMALASAPVFLAVALAAELYGRYAVAVAAAAFTAGALVAPRIARLVDRRRINALALWPALGVVMILGWAIAPSHLLGLALAQFLSGLALSTFEGTMDARIARSHRGSGTVGLARTGAARALGGAVAVATVPAIIRTTSLPTFSVLAATLLAAAGLAGLVFVALRRRNAVDEEALTQWAAPLRVPSVPR